METITEIKRFEATGKDSGKKYTRLILKIKSRGDKEISGFGNVYNESWKVGDSVDILITEKGQYLNFVMADSKKAEEITMTHRLQGIEITLGFIKNYLQVNLPKRTSDGKLAPDFGENVTDDELGF